MSSDRHALVSLAGLSVIVDVPDAHAHVLDELEAKVRAALPGVTVTRQMVSRLYAFAGSVAARDGLGERIRAWMRAKGWTLTIKG